MSCMFHLWHPPRLSDRCKQGKRLQEPVGKGGELSREHRAAHENHDATGKQTEAATDAAYCLQLRQETIGERRRDHERDAKPERIGRQQCRALADRRRSRAYCEDRAEDGTYAGTPAERECHSEKISAARPSPRNRCVKTQLALEP